MSKRKAEENGEGSGSADDEVPEERERGLGKGGMSKLLQSAPVVERNREGMVNPFADDEDDDDEEEVSSDEDGVAPMRRQRLRRGSGEDDEGESSGGWQRGSWWRGVVRRKPKAGAVGGDDKERFGDGRDDLDEDEEDVRSRSAGSDDEEFGDFAMPEVDKSGGAGSAADGAGSEFDAEREKVLLKPLPVHPPASGNKSSAFSSLWPFSNAAKKEDGGAPAAADEKDGGAADDAVATPTTPTSTDPEKGVAEIAEEPEVLEKEKAGEDPAAELEVVSDDGTKLERTVEARRRTSIEEPDEDEEGQVVV